MACAGRGLHVMKTEAYGPQIRGGESSSTVRIGAMPLYAQADVVDALVAFRFSDFARFSNEITLSESAVVLHEPDDAPPPELAQRSRAVPFTELAKNAGAPSARNIVAIGALAAMYHLPIEGLRAAIRHRFGKKNATVIDANLRALDAGFEHGGFGSYATDTPQGSSDLLLLSGNEAADARSSPVTRSRHPQRSCTSSRSGCRRSAAPACRLRTSWRQSGRSSARPSRARNR